MHLPAPPTMEARSAVKYWLTLKRLKIWNTLSTKTSAPQELRWKQVVIKEKRTSARQSLFLRAFIRTPQNNSIIDCIVRDISETGAKLRFRCRPSITDSLELYIPARGQIVQSKLVWIDNCEVGVSFDSIVAVGTAPSSSDGELSVRMARLEDEITALKKVLNRLQKQADKTEAA
jgi:hypothetical protein